MEDGDFEMLFEILKMLEKEDLKGSSISVAMTNLIDNLGGQLSPDQRLLIAREFMKYMGEGPREIPDYRRDFESYF